MIGRIAGILLHRASDHVLIDVRGVGYLVHVSDRTLLGLPRPGEAVALHTELVVREDLLQLIGFASLVEKEWYRLLVSVQGVGARVALAILGTLGPEGLGRALALGDWSALRKAPGVGPKLAQRIAIELRDKAPAVMALGADPAIPSMPMPAPLPDPDALPAPRPAGAGAGPPPAATPAEPAAAPPDPGRAMAEALSALANLGYAPAEAAGAVARAADAEPRATTPALIRAALRLLAPRE